MRPYGFVLVAFTVLLACSDAAMAKTSAVRAVDELSPKRMLRQEVPNTTGDDEERVLGLNHLKLWNMKRSANSEIQKAEKAAAKTLKDAEKAAHQTAVKYAQEAAKAAGVEAKDAKLAATFIKKGWSPEKVGERLKVEKFGNDQKISKFMETYKDMYAKAWGKDAAAGAKAEAKAA